MFSLIKELFSLLTPSQRKRYFCLQVLVGLMAVMELLGIASIGPFMAVVADVGLLDTNPIYNKLYQASGVSNPNDFLILAGGGVLAMLALASVISMITTWRLSLFAYGVGVEIADRLYSHYLHQDWLFHASGSSAQLTKQIATEAQRVTQQIIQPLMQLNARAVLVVLLSVAILLYNPVVALAGLLLFVSGYWIIYRVVRFRIVRFGHHVSEANAQRFRLMNEGFGGIKDVLLLNRRQYFIDQFNQSGKRLARAQGVNAALGQIPRYFMELLAFGSMISLVLVLLKVHDSGIGQVLPVLAVYALAGFKLLPALQQIYQSITQIKGGTAAFESIKPDLIASAFASDSGEATRRDAIPPLQSLQDKALSHCAGLRAFDEGAGGCEERLDIQNYNSICLENVSFRYPGKLTAALRDISLQVPVNSTVGFVGESGSGKSTTIDLLLGLIEPCEGQLLLDAVPIVPGNKAAYQANIGFVPQSIFLGEGSIAENIAFGLANNKIDLEKVKQAATLAHLIPLIDSLPNGFDTKVGERGVQLSGGQRQRIGIARALYNNSQLLIFDEATSALDGITERIIMDAIQELSGKRTIILIAHRLKTVQHCNIVYLMDQGRIIDKGTYEELMLRNSIFKKMAKHA